MKTLTYCILLKSRDYRCGRGIFKNWMTVEDFRPYPTQFQVPVLEYRKASSRRDIPTIDSKVHYVWIT